MPNAQRLLDAVYRNPDADAHRLVYADFLRDRGDPLGEFIHLQIARAGGARGTLPRERWLLAAAGDRWWQGHPAWFGRSGAQIPLEATRRGFPSVFDCSWSTDESAAAAQRRRVAGLKGARGWSTVGEMTLHREMPPEVAASLLDSSALISLRTLSAVPAQALAPLAASALPVESLSLCLEEGQELPVVTGLPALRHLTLELNAPLAAAVAALEASGLLARLESLELQGVSSAAPLLDALTAFGSMPAALCRFEVNHFRGKRTVLSGPHAAPHVRLTVDTFRAQKLTATLAELPRAALGSIHVELVRGGFFTRRSSPLLRAHLEKALAKWASRGTTGWQ